jgi:membrane protein
MSIAMLVWRASDGARARSVVPDAVRRLLGVLRQAAVEWWDDDVFQLSAALAFYTVFSLAPLIVIALAVASVVFGEEQATRALISQVQSLIGSAGAEAVRAVVENARVAGDSRVATLLGIVTLAIGATAIFAQLQTALNRIWDVRVVAGRGVMARLLRDRLLGLALAIGTGFLLIVSLVMSAVISAASHVWIGGVSEIPWLWSLVETGVGLFVVTALYMVIYRVLPDAEIAWRDVAVGAFVSAALFTLGKYLIGMYLGSASIGDVYGAAGSLVALLVWVYYTAVVSFFGAEFTQVYARRHGSRIEPSEHAVRRGRGKPATEPAED